MPELPEVETIRLGLARLIVGKTVQSTRNYDSPKSFPNSPAMVEQFLLGASVTDVRRRAKMLLIDLSSGYTLMIHLKMTGQLVFVKEGPAAPLGSEVNSERALHPLKLARSARTDVGESRWGGGHPTDSLLGKLPDKSSRQEIMFADGSVLFFNDQRKFGYVKLEPTAEVPNTKFMLRVGPEPLEDEFTGQVLFERLERRKNTTIKAAILDQSVLAGVGNIYADEALWAAKIHPSTLVKNVPKSKVYNLASAIKSVMNLSLEKGGSTDRNYIDAEGKKGSYLKFANVFRREDQPCNRCGTVLEKIRVAGRGTHICPTCQVIQ